MEKIFISIASYRDSELIPTINDAIDNCYNKNNLMFGLCIQDTSENLYNFPFKEENFKILKINFKDSKGCNWARRNIQDKLYNNEKYYLQIDSHTRFVKDWDIKLIKMLNDCPSNKPIISTHPNPYNIDDFEKKYLLNKFPHRIGIKYFNEDGLTLNIHANILNKTLQKSLWIAGGFLFTYGYWNNEVKHDESIYFNGGEEEITIKSFTNGWDIFCPDDSILFHCYENNIKNNTKYRILHWEDHNNVKKKLDILKELYNGIGIGSKRSIKDFEKYSGISFKNKHLYQNAKLGLCIDDFKIYRKENLNLKI